MELDHIDKNTESMQTLIMKINQLLDTISIEFNSVEDSKDSVVAGETIVEDSQRVSKNVIGKSFKFGTSPLDSVKNNTAFVDKADLKLKFKDKNGIVTPLT